MSPRQRKGAGAGEGAAAPGGVDGGQGGGEGATPAGFKFGVCQYLSIFLIFVIFCCAGLVIFLHIEPMHIHSCRVYVPHKIRALTHAFNSVYYYGERNSFTDLWNQLSAAVHADGLNFQAPSVCMSEEGEDTVEAYALIRLNIRTFYIECF